MRNFRSTFFLAIVLLGLFAYFFFIDRHHQGTAEEERAKTVLFGADAAQATALKITDPQGQGAIVLDKKDGAWKIRQPVAADADPAAVEAVLGQLQGLESRRLIELSEIPDRGEALPQWGLSPAGIRIEFSAPDFSGVLLIGRKTAINDLVYARAFRAGDGREAAAPVHLIPSASRDAIDKKLDDLRSRAVLPVESAKLSQVSRFGLRIAPGTATAPVEYEIDRQGQTEAKGDAWKLQKPLAAEADARRVTAWLGRLAALQVKQFIADDAANLSTYGLSAPASQLWIETAGKSDAKAPATLLIGVPVPGAADEVYAKRLSGNAVFTLSAAEVDKVLHDLPDLRDRHLLSVVPADATGLRVEAKGRTVEAARKDGAWSFTPATVPPLPAGSGEADPEKIGAFLQSLKDLEAAEIVSDTTSDLKPYGLDHPTARVVVTVKKGGQEDAVTLLLGRIDKAQAPATATAPAPAIPTGRLYAKTSQEPFIYALDPAFLDQLPKDATSWVRPPAPSAPIAPVSAKP